MKEITLKNISFVSYLKIFFVSGIGTGLAMGIFYFILGLLGRSVNTDLGFVEFTGFWAGVVALFLSPIVSAGTFVFAAALMYRPFKFLLRVLKGFKLSVVLDETEDLTEPDAAYEKPKE